MATQQQMTLAEYLAVVRRRKWLIIIAVLVSTGSALFFSSRQAKLYEASAQVLVNPDASLVQGASHSASDSQARFDTTQAELAHTPDVAKIAIKGAGVPGIGANDLIAKSSVSSDSSSNILNFAVSNANPAVAVKLVNAYVRAFTVFGSQVNAQTIQQAIDGATQSINNLSARITTARKAGSVPAGLQTELRALVRKTGAVPTREACSKRQRPGGTLRSVGDADPARPAERCGTGAYARSGAWSCDGVPPRVTRYTGALIGRNREWHGPQTPRTNPDPTKRYPVKEPSGGAI